MRMTFRDPLVQHTAPEDSSFTIAVKFWDDSAEPWTASAPTTVHYRIDCLTTGTVLVDWTSVSPSASVSLTVSVAANAINQEANWREKRQVTVKADDALSTQYLGTHCYYVENNVAV
jgi:hypothetical protein